MEKGTTAYEEGTIAYEEGTTASLLLAQLCSRFGSFLTQFLFVGWKKTKVM